MRKRKSHLLTNLSQARSTRWGGSNQAPTELDSALPEIADAGTSLSTELDTSQTATTVSVPRQAAIEAAAIVSTLYRTHGQKGGLKKQHRIVDSEAEQIENPGSVLADKVIPMALDCENPEAMIAEEVDLLPLITDAKALLAVLFEPGAVDVPGSIMAQKPLSQLGQRRVQQIIQGASSIIARICTIIHPQDPDALLSRVSLTQYVRDQGSEQRDASHIKGKLEGVRTLLKNKKAKYKYLKEKNKQNTKFILLRKMLLRGANLAEIASSIPRL
ncbi:hypothetical protein HDU77_001537 [Chytriomyces hyalinus]|nr:hypothetical protein HDU77_001537 [Chytriomyces hyalinus]